MDINAEDIMVSIMNEKPYDFDAPKEKVEISGSWNDRDCSEVES